MITRRIFTLTAVAGLALGSSPPWLPNDALADAREVYPDQWCMVHCLGYDGQRLEGMSQLAHVQWVGAEYMVTTPLHFCALHACTVIGFEIEPLLKRGEVTNRPNMLGGDWLALLVTLRIS